MTFAYPAILLLLWFVPCPALLILWLRRRGKSRVSKLVHPNTIKNRGQRTSDTLFNTQIALLTLALALLVVAAARPRWGQRENVFMTSGRNVLIMLDVSRSMLANDVHPNRLERAKADVADLFEVLQGDRPGIMAFRNGAALLCPFTTDMAFLNQTLAGITIDSAPRGETDIGSAIEAALQTFENLGTDHNAIILISDGEDLSGKAVEKAAAAGERRIPIFCVGIGDSRGSTIPVEDSGAVMEYRGENVVTKLENKTLIDIANASKGSYIPLQTAGTGRNTLGSLYNRHVRAIEAQEMQERRETTLVERYQIFLIPAVILLLAGTALSCGRPGKRRMIKQTAATATAILLLALPAKSIAATNETVSAPASPAPGSLTDLNAREIGRRAQKAWQGGDSATAADLYIQALEKEQPDPELTQTMRFNAAIASLKAGNSGKAAEIFRQIASDNQYGDKAAEGLGVALFRAAEAMSAIEPESVEDAGKAAAEKLKLFEESAAAFQQALRKLPGDPLRTQNLQAALADIPELRAQAHEAAVQAKYGDKEVGELITELISRQREVFKGAATAFTNDSPARIQLLENAAVAQREGVDMWGPIRDKMMEAARTSITNNSQLADFQYQLDVAKDRADGAVDALENLDESALGAIRQSEEAAMAMLAYTTEPPAVLRQAMNSESNALAEVFDKTAIRTPISEQTMANGMFNVFAQTYGSWLDKMMPTRTEAPDRHFVSTNEVEEADSNTSTNKMEMTEAVRAEIDGLVDKTLGSLALVNMGIGRGDELLSGQARINARQSLDNMQLIYDLLPKPPQQNQQQDQQQEQQNKDQQQQQSNQDEDSQNKEDSSDSGEDESSDNQQPQMPEQQEEQQSEPMQEPKSAEQKEAERIMAQILEQEKEREEARLETLNAMPPRIGVRDW